MRSPRGESPSPNDDSLDALTKQQVVDRLQLMPHPEGGYFRETYRSGAAFQVEGRGSRAACTGKADKSHLHVIKSDEMWHHYAGRNLIIYELDPLAGRPKGGTEVGKNSVSSEEEVQERDEEFAEMEKKSEEKKEESKEKEELCMNGVNEKKTTQKNHEVEECCAKKRCFYQETILGKQASPKAGKKLVEPQYTVVEGKIFGALPEYSTWDSEEDWALVGCTVSPGFDFADFSLPTKQELLDLFCCAEERDSVEQKNDPALKKKVFDLIHTLAAPE